MRGNGAGGYEVLPERNVCRCTPSRGQVRQLASDEHRRCNVESMDTYTVHGGSVPLVISTVRGG